MNCGLLEPRCVGIDMPHRALLDVDLGRSDFV